MERELLMGAIAALSTIASTYFWLDRKTTNARITGKGAEIKALEDKVQTMSIEINTLKSKLESNEKIEMLRTELIKSSLTNMEKNIDEIKGGMKTLTDNILKGLLNKQNG